MLLQIDAAVAVLLPLLVALAGAGVAYVGYRKLEPELRRLRDDPLPVREAATTDGLVELRGTVETEGQYLEAPFTGTSCVAYEFEAEEYVSSGKHSHWDTLAEGNHAIPFRLADGTGSILVEPEDSELTLQSGWETEIGAEESAKDRIREFLTALDVEPGEGSELSVGPISVGTGDRRRYSEERLDVGETVSVFGRPEYDPDAGGEWGSDEVDAAMRATDEDPFVVADTVSVPTFRTSTMVSAGVVVFGLALVVAGLWSAVAALSGVVGA